MGKYLIVRYLVRRSMEVQDKDEACLKQKTVIIAQLLAQ